jgi:hypothetical protein
MIGAATTADGKRAFFLASNLFSSFSLAACCLSNCFAARASFSWRFCAAQHVP